MNKEQVFGIIRAILAALGGVFVSKGVFDSGALDSIISAVLVIGAAVWSVLEKQQIKKKDEEIAAVADAAGVTLPTKS
jgi:hypothetical protein